MLRHTREPPISSSRLPHDFPALERTIERSNAAPHDNANTFPLLELIRRHRALCYRRRYHTRNLGLIGAIELEPIAGQPTKRAFAAFLNAYEKGLPIRTTGDIIALSPPLIVAKAQIDELVGILSDILKELA